MGRECEVNVNRLYKYKSYYLVVEYNLDGNEDNEDFRLTRDSLEGVLQDSATMIHESQYDYNIHLRSNLRLCQLTEIFAKLSNKNAYIKYMNDNYDNYILENYNLSK